VTAAYIGLGSNLGDRKANLRAALEALAKKVRVSAVSSLYETEPVGPPQPMYYNAVAAIEPDVAPAALLGTLWEIERSLGRDPKHERNAPREIDLDILMFGALKLNSARLTLPHPRMAERAFVLVPLAEIAPDVIHPVERRFIRDLAREVGSGGVTRVEKRGWER
jgi:2-amino-4-hydroxy-6-hydroxymethyldihydropteridine diphosphokinase